MCDFMKTARAACVKIKHRYCCYGTERTNVRDFCDCKILSCGVPSGLGGEETGCAEARTIRDFLDQVVREGYYDEGELERCGTYAQILQAAFHVALHSCRLPVRCHRSSRSLTCIDDEVELRTFNVNCKTCQPIKDGPDSGYGCYEASIIRGALRKIREHYPARISSSLCSQPHPNYRPVDTPDNNGSADDPPPMV